MVLKSHNLFGNQFLSVVLYATPRTDHSFVVSWVISRTLVAQNAISTVCGNNGKKSYLTIRDEACNDASFRDRELTLLETLNFGMVSQFASDPMHLLDEGVMARMLQSIFFNRTCAVRESSF